MAHRIATLYTTVGTEEEAVHLAQLALSSQMAACVNITPNGKSIYLWESKIEQASEYYILFKTTEILISSLEQLIIKNHPYNLPAILKLNIEASEKFASYVAQSVLKKP